VTSRRSTSSRPGDGRGRSRPKAAATPSTRGATRTTSRAATEPDAPTSGARSKLTGRAAVLLLVLAVLAVSYASSTRAWLRQRNEIADLTAQIKASQAAIDGLQQEKLRWGDPAYIKQQAHERFGWVMPGETGYRVIGDDGKTLVGGGTSQLADPVTPQSSDGPQWWETAWSSVVGAGEPPEAQDPSSGPDPAATIGPDGHQSSSR
jgi:cell division protein FtsB